ncbi:INE protein, partial [Polypterus senegalus]
MCNQNGTTKLERNTAVDSSQDGDRGAWSHGFEFTLACIGAAVGLGNVWRFPYLCYRSGGGAFLIPYLVMLLLCGIPLLFMEFSIGQYTRLGPVHAMAKICPLLKGVGVATVAISFILCTYYNVIITWALYYLFNSFQSTMPWQTCNNTWNIPENCSSGFPGNATHLQSASQQFFDRNLLRKTDGIDQIGKMRWELFGLLILSWVIVYLCIFKGVHSTGKVWVNAAAQIFNSIGISFGQMISMASYNKFNNNILRDTLIVSLTNSVTSIFAGFVIFSAIGYMAHIHNLPVDNIATDGPGLVFVVYPEAFTTMPLASMWAALFFFMLLCLGIDSQFAMVEVMVTSLTDSFGKSLLKVLRRKELLVMVVCFVAFVLGIPNVAETILISSIIQYSPARYGKDYTYPAWAEVLGWFISLSSIIWIPLGALHTLYTLPGSLWQVSHHSEVVDSFFHSQP